MTTPDIAMPVSFTLVRQAGLDHLMRADGGDHYRLEGPSLVAASWSGPQKAELWHHHNTGEGFQWRKLAEFNGGGEPQSESGQNPGRESWCMSVLQLLRRMWPRTTGGRLRSIRSSVWGGGVNDGPPIRHHRPVRGPQAGIVEHRSSRRDCRRQGSEGYRYGNLVTRRGASNRDRFRREAMVLNLRRGWDAFWRVGTAQKPNGQSGARPTERSASVYLDRESVEASACRADNFPVASRVALAGVAA